MECLFLGAFLIFIFKGVIGINQFNTFEGCNATFVCYHSLGVPVNWINTTEPIQHGPKVIIKNTDYYSTLTLTSITASDNGTITCRTNQSHALNFFLNVQVLCEDIFITKTCKGQVDGGDPCTNQWMIDNCKKSCGLCPKYNCTESEHPTALVTSVVPTTTMTTGRPTDNLSGTQIKVPSSTSTTTKASTTETKRTAPSSASKCFNHVLVVLMFLLAVASSSIFIILNTIT